MINNRSFIAPSQDEMEDLIHEELSFTDEELSDKEAEKEKMVREITSSPIPCSPQPLPRPPVEMPGYDPRPGPVSNFRMQNKYVLLTYKTHIPKPLLKIHIETLKNNVKEMHIAHETGDEHCPYPHTHVAVEFKTLFSTQNCRMFDFEDIHPNIRILPGKKAYQDALVYISKEDPECAHLKRDTSLSIVRRVLQCETVVEALEKNCESINQANGIVTIFNLKEHSVEPEAPILM